MKCSLLFIIVNFIFLFSYSQLVNRNLLSKFSRETLDASLMYPGEWKPFPKTPAEWKIYLPDSIIQKIIRQGESNLGIQFEPVPASLALLYLRNGDRASYEAISFRKRNQLWSLVMAESIEGKGRFIDQIMDVVFSISEETFWGSTAHIHYQKAGPGLPDAEDPTVDLFAAETAVVMALTDYFAGDALDQISPLIRKRIYHEVNRRVLVPMQTANYPWLGLDNPQKKLNNWAPWVMSNYIAVNLLLEKDLDRRNKAILHALGIIDHYLNGLGEDGSCEEGPSYWWAASGAVYDALDILASASSGKISIHDHPFFRKTGAYIYNMHIAGRYFVNNADADPELTPDGPLLYRFGKAVNDPVMINFGTWAFQSFGIKEGAGSHRMRVLFNYLSLSEMLGKPRAEYPAIPPAWMPDVQVMTSRSFNGFFLASHGGHNAEGHNHNDVGDFTIYSNGYPVIIDVGRGTYTYKVFHEERYSLWFNNSSYHNLPVINGQTQPNGRQYEATGVSFQQTGARTELKMDIAKAYPEKAGLEKWIRTVSSQDKGITVRDEFRMVSGLSGLSHSLMTVCDVSFDKPGRITFSLPDRSRIYMSYDPAKWEAVQEVIQLTEPEDQKFKTSWHGKDIIRVLLSWKKNDQRGQYEFYFYK